MNRRDTVKRIGAATVGTGALAAAASGAEPSEVEIDGQRYLTFRDPETVSREAVQQADLCDCENCALRYCNICGPCP